MRIRTKVAVFFLSILFLLIIIISLSSRVSQYANLITVKDVERNDSLLLSQALLRTSDDLTRMARLYCLTGDQKYMNAFNEIIAIREGEAKRPLNYSITYWDEQLFGEYSTDETLYSEPKSFQLLLMQNGVTNLELEKLKLSEDLSNELADLEYEAFKLVERGTEESRKLAIEMLYSDEYYDNKMKIRKPLKEFSDMISIRVLKEISTYRDKEIYYSNIMNLLIIVSIFYTIFAYYSVKRCIIFPIDKLSKVAKKIEEGNIDVRGEIRLDDEIGELTESFNKMSDQLSNQIKELDAQKSVMDEHAIMSIADDNGTIIYVNDKFCETSGYNEDELLGSNHNISKSGWHPSLYYEDIWNKISNGEIWSGELKNKKKNGDYYWLWATIAPIMGVNNKPVKYISIRTDITDQKNIEQKLIDAKKAAEDATKAKSSFLANMSHEIRTPMNAIIGFTDLTLKSDDLSEVIFQYVSKVNNAAKHLLIIINDILDFSKIEAGKLVLESNCFNMENIIAETLEVLEQESNRKNLTLSYEYSHHLTKCFIGDESRVKQILLNIVGNAVKFTNEGSIKIIVNNYKSNIYFQIVDTGIGMTQQQIETIFDSFSQADTSTLRKFGGTGLGTTISKELVESMGGEIWVESKLNQGSVFHFTLCLIPEECNESEQFVEVSKSSPVLQINNLNILLAEDNELNGELIEINLGENLDNEITWVKDGRHCVDEYKKNNVKYDLILMDFQMPALDGLSATKEIRNWEKQLDSQIVIIALTASVTEEDKEKCMEAGMNGFIRKPIDFKKLNDLILKLLPESNINEIKNNSVRNKKKGNSRLKDIDSIINIELGLKAWITEENYVNALKRFSRDYCDVGYELEECISRRDVNCALELTHKLKGMTLGLNELREYTIKFEENLSDDKLEHAQYSLTQLVGYLDRVMDKINDIEGDEKKEIVTNKEAKILYDELLKVLEEDNPEPAERILLELKPLINISLYASVEDKVNNYDFDGAKEQVHEIINKGK